VVFRFLKTLDDKITVDIENLSKENIDGLLSKAN
jgi:hypothetical protein